MSLDKAIQHGKEHRGPYFGSRRFDKTCRCHGGCPWCQRARLLWMRKMKADIKLRGES